MLHTLPVAGKENVSGQAMMEPQARPREEKPVAVIEQPPARTVPVAEEAVMDRSVAADTATNVSAGKGLGVEFGEVIDMKYFTGVEDRPQEQVLGESAMVHIWS